jgi:hypothetical protein
MSTRKEYERVPARPGNRHDVSFATEADGRIVVRIDGISCPHRHWTKAGANRCLWRWNDVEYRRRIEELTVDELASIAIALTGERNA